MSKIYGPWLPNVLGMPLNEANIIATMLIREPGLAAAPYGCNPTFHYWGKGVQFQGNGGSLLVVKFG